MALCSICKTRHAIIFTSRFEAGKRIDEGFCLKCAYESGIAGVSDMFKATGINGDNIDEMSERIEDMIGNNDVNADPSEFLRSLASGEFGGDMDDDDDGYEFDEDSTPINVADADEGKGDSDEDEERKKGFLGGMFGRRPGSQAGKGEEKKGDKLKNRSRMKYLNEFGTNLTARAAEGKIDRIIGRDTEIERCIQILNRRTKNNPVLIGAPGVGKTAVAQGLAVKIVEGSVPEKL
ncbi:MAG: ATP-dependent Clp protease ATP-binding subunit, partial [Clostridiales bacterium]|nr:ATP-dependent Clp protease ATP-binding subunit [Clostridiales bacterium]